LCPKQAYRKKIKKKLKKNTTRPNLFIKTTIYIKNGLILNSKSIHNFVNININQQLKFMRKKLKLLKTLLFVTLMALTAGCETEKKGIHSGKTPYEFKKISFENFKQQTGLNDFDTKINIAPATAAVQNKSTDGTYELTDFDINTQSINSVLYQGKTTYTFKVEPNNYLGTNFFNLIVCKINNVWEKTIIEMKPAENTPNNESLSPIGATRQLYASTPSVLKCFTSTYNDCPFPGDCNGPGGSCDGCELCVVTATSCYPEFFGGSWIGGAGEFVLPNDFSTVPGPDAIVYEPNLDHNSINQVGELQIKTPCQTIKAQTNNQAFMTKFNAINKTANFNATAETGFYQEVVNGVKTYKDGVPGGNNSLIIPKTALNYTHVHNKDEQEDGDVGIIDVNVKIHSPLDIYKLLKHCKQSCLDAGGVGEDAFGITMSNMGIFSLNIIDANFDFNLVMLELNVFAKKYEKKADEIIKSNMSSTNKKEALQTMLLNGLKSMGLENKVGLFEGTAPTGANNTSISWTRKTIVGETLTTTPCQ
jgi:hypothetical protein